jgi:hypothetical protein
MNDETSFLLGVMIGHRVLSSKSISRAFLYSNRLGLVDVVDEAEAIAHQRSGVQGQREGAGTGQADQQRLIADRLYLRR